ncbi:MAG: YncE family protein [candidate division WOR-3 bacterium]|nr:YncE family protein [candidate division WOR-3 bacterium]
MKTASVLLAVSCWLSAVSGQWFEKSIGLPDSLGNLEYPWAAYYVPSSNCVYVAGADGVMVVDAATDARVARMDLECPMYMAFDSRDDKMYLSTNYYDYEGESLSVVDALSHRLVSRIRVGWYPGPVCYNPTANKVYCIVGEESLAVIDCTTDSVLARFWVGYSSYDYCTMYCDTAGNKVYITSYDVDGVAVVDGVGDSLLKFLTVGDHPYGLAYSPVSNKLYCSVHDSDVVAVFDAGPDTLLGRVSVGDGPAKLGYNPLSNKVYCGDDHAGTVDIIDCSADTVLASVGETDDNLTSFVFDSVDNRIFCVPYYYEQILAISGDRDSIVGQVELENAGEYPDPACYSPLQNRLYLVGEETPDLAVVDAATCAVTGSVQMSSDPYVVCYAAAQDKLYCLDYESGSIAVIDCSTSRLLRMISTPATRLRLPVYSSGSGKLYCAARRGSDYVLVAIDCVRDSVVATLQMSSRTYALAYNPTNDRVYYANYDDVASTVTVVDCRRDSIVVDVPVGRYTGGLTCNLDSNRVYCASNLDDTLCISAIDCSGDTVTSTVKVHQGQSSSSVSMCYIPSLDVVCSTTGSDDIVVVDGAARQVLGPLPLGGQPTRLLFNPVSNKLYGLVPDANNLVVIDCRYMSLETTVRLAAYPTEMGFDSIANRVYTTHSSYGCVSVVDGQTSRFLGLVEAGVSPGALAWVPQHRRMYIADEDGHAVIVLKDSAVAGLAGEPAPVLSRSMATIVRGVLVLGDCPRTGTVPKTVPRDRVPKPALLDISGRKVLDLHPDANDVRHLAPGVYFIREAQAQAQAQTIRKVVVTR